MGRHDWDTKVFRRRLDVLGSLAVGDVLGESMNVVLGLVEGQYFCTQRTEGGQFRELEVVRVGSRDPVYVSVSVVDVKSGYVGISDAEYYREDRVLAYWESQVRKLTEGEVENPLYVPFEESVLWKASYAQTDREKVREARMVAEMEYNLMPISYRVLSVHQADIIDGKVLVSSCRPGLYSLEMGTDQGGRVVAVRLFWSVDGGQ